MTTIKIENWWGYSLEAEMEELENGFLLLERVKYPNDFPSGLIPFVLFSPDGKMDIIALTTKGEAHELAHSLQAIVPPKQVRLSRNHRLMYAGELATVPYRYGELNLVQLRGRMGIGFFPDDQLEAVS